MLNLTTKPGEGRRIAVFADSKFIGWVSVERLNYGQAMLGFDGFDAWSFTLEHRLSDEQKTAIEDYEVDKRAKMCVG